MGKLSVYFLGLLLVLFFFSCSNQPSSSSSSGSSVNTDVKLKNYIGSTSIGDIVWYGVDSSKKELQFSNITRGYTWQALYTEQADGTCKFTIPILNKEAVFIEVPDKMLVVNFYIRDTNDNKDYPTFAVLVPQRVNSFDDLTTFKGFYAVLDAVRCTASGYTNGLYLLDVSAVDVNFTNWWHYKGTDDGLSNDSWGFVGFSNEIKSAYAYDPNNPNFVLPMFTSDTTFAADKGVDAGFMIGLKIRTNSVDASDVAGEYIVMSFQQERKKYETNYQTILICGIVKLSNNSSANLVEVWHEDTNYLDSFNIQAFPVIGKSFQIYVAFNTNGKGGMLLSEDLSYGIYIQGDGKNMMILIMITLLDLAFLKKK